MSVSDWIVPEDVGASADLGRADLDAACGGFVQKVSRKQIRVTACSDGTWELERLGPHASFVQEGDRAAERLNLSSSTRPGESARTPWVHTRACPARFYTGTGFRITNGTRPVVFPHAGHTRHAHIPTSPQAPSSPLSPSLSLPWQICSPRSASTPSRTPGIHTSETPVSTAPLRRAASWV